MAKPKPLRSQKAIDWLAAKQPITRAQWDKISWESARRAFMVSGVAKVDVIKSVRDAMIRNAKRGGGLAEFQKMVGPMLRREWQGSVANPAARIKTIYVTNMQSAYMAARWQAMQRTKASKPFAVFNAVNDGKTSERCSRLDGKIASLEAWERRGYVPPLHFNCRSVLEPLPAKDAKKLGITARLPTINITHGFGLPSLAEEWTPELKSYPNDLKRFIKANLAAAKKAQPSTNPPKQVVDRQVVIDNAMTRLGASEYLKQHPVKIQFTQLKNRKASGVYNPTKKSIRIKDPRIGKINQPIDAKLHSVSSAALTEEEALQRTLIHELVHHIRKTNPAIAKATELHWKSGGAVPISKVGKLNESEYLSELMVASLFHPNELQKLDPKGYTLASDVLSKIRDPKFLMQHELPKPKVVKAKPAAAPKPSPALPSNQVVSAPGPAIAKPAKPTVAAPMPAKVVRKPKPQVPSTFDYDQLEDGQKEFEKIVTTGVKTMHSELYSKATGKMFPKMAPDEEAAAFAFTYQHDYVIRMLDRGKATREEIAAGYIKHMASKAVSITVSDADAKAFVEKCEGYRKKLYEMMETRPKQPTPDGFVYRGMHSIKESTLRDFFAKHLDLGALSSSTVSPNRAAQFAADPKHKDQIGGERAFRVILKLRNKRGFSVQDASQFPSESEVLLPKSKYRILKAKKHRGSHLGTKDADWVIIEAEEIDE